MKHLLIAILLLLCAQCAFSQTGPILPQEYENRKSLSIGITYQNLNLRGLNALLEPAGYGSVTEGITCVSVSNNVRYNNGLGFFYSGDFGLDNEDNKTIRYKKYQYYRMEAGLEYRALQLQHLACFAHMGIGYSTYTLRLYDGVHDSTVSGYIQGGADARRLQAGIAGLNVGMQSRVLLGKSLFLGFGGGCVVPLGRADWNHDGDDFTDAPSVQLATWYAQAKVGVEFRRKITRLKDDRSVADEINDDVPDKKPAPATNTLQRRLALRI